MTTEPVIDADFVEWHGGCPHALVWAVDLDRDDVTALTARARARLAPLLLRRYARQPHLTLAYAGLAPTPGATPTDRVYGDAEFAADLAALVSAAVAPFDLVIGAFGSFAGAPYLAADGAGVAALHEALEARPGPYTPHVTIGLYATRAPLAPIISSFADWTETLVVHVPTVSLLRYETHDVAGPLEPVGRFDLATRTWTPA